MHVVIFNKLLFVALLAVCAALPSPHKKSAPNEDTAGGHVKTLKYRNSVGEIVKDLISNWNSPIVYLRNRGYLQAPQINFDVLEKEANSKDPETSKSKRSNEYESPSDLNHLFRSLFASNDNSISDKIKLKLGVAWDMDKLKTSVRNEAHKFYENYYNKRNQLVTKDQEQGHDHQLNGDPDIEKQVAQLYPSVIPNPNAEHTDEEEKGESLQASKEFSKETKFLNGIAKLLTNRELRTKVKALPMQGEMRKKVVS